MKPRSPIGGIIHTYQKYDPKSFPSPTQPPPDVVSPAFEHLLMYGNMRRLTPEELARAIKIDPSQIAGLGPSLESLMAILRERKRKILATYETDAVSTAARKAYHDYGEKITPPGPLKQRYQQAKQEEQLHDLERLWYQAGDDRSKFARQLVQLVARLGDKYQIDELAAKYAFSGRTPMDVPKGLAVKEELETIDRLLKQLEEAAETAQIGVIDMEELAEFTEPGDLDQLNQLRQQIEEYLKQIAEQQGLEQDRAGYNLSPKAHRLFQGKLLEKIFSQLQASRTGRHSGPILGEGAVELQTT